jgi:hypothetical protein
MAANTYLAGDLGATKSDVPLQLDAGSKSSKKEVKQKVRFRHKKGKRR